MQGFHIFVVVVGVLILSGAVNTSLIGANGIQTRGTLRLTSSRLTT